MVTDTARPPATNTHKHRQDRLRYTAPLASAQCNKFFFSNTAILSNSRALQLVHSRVPFSLGREYISGGNDVVSAGARWRPYDAVIDVFIIRHKHRTPTPPPHRQLQQQQLCETSDVSFTSVLRRLFLFPLRAANFNLKLIFPETGWVYKRPITTRSRDH